ncbi:MAG TPA: hypothetical protein VFL14_09830 [Xanthomonadales bacterium]|nr:hypothetical protein [Xanthomonadales bacterium]
MLRLSPLATGVLLLALAPTASASFHVMQIEQVVASSSTAQAIQLRMRSLGQNQVQFSRVRAWSADGTSITVLVDMTTPVAQNAGGARVLLATPAFVAANPRITPDFIMQPIPADALAAGRITFEDDTGPILWSLCWGGAGYTGPTSGAITNDGDGNFGPCVAPPLPLDARGILFSGSATASSTNNLADYAITPGPATVTNNAGQSAVVVDLFADGFESPATMAAEVTAKAAAAAKSAPRPRAHDHGSGFVSEAQAAHGH